MSTYKNIINTARRTLSIEAESLRQLMESIDKKFEATVECLVSLEGRVVLTGIGKSAIVAQKIVATFNSTGTQAIFMHAADAIHGDLGMIDAKDAVICLSKSGETPEIRVLISLLRNFGNPIIGMTANENSFLAKNADFLLHTPITQEADPNNLAPTSSTIVQMAMGDALAICLLALRGFTPKDFAQFHPGGALGKQLYLKVKDLSDANECPAVTSDASLRDVILEMTSKRLGITAVLRGDELLGVITDGDLRRMLTREITERNLTAESIMSPNPKTISQDALAVKALELMRTHSITQLVVTDGDNYAGIVHLHDLIREGLV